jgi:hypothetical protein
MKAKLRIVEGTFPIPQAESDEPFAFMLPACVLFRDNSGASSLEAASEGPDLYR